MLGVEVKIKLRNCKSDYSYQIFLYFSSQEQAQYEFWDPWFNIKNSETANIPRLSAPKGTILVGRHFINDYAKSNEFELQIDNVVIKKVKVLFNIDEEIKSQYDNIQIKDVIIQIIR